MLAGGVGNCPLRGGFFYVENHMGLILLSIILSTGVSVLEGVINARNFRVKQSGHASLSVTTRCPL